DGGVHFIAAFIDDAADAVIVLAGLRRRRRLGLDVARRAGRVGRRCAEGRSHGKHDGGKGVFHGVVPVDGALLRRHSPGLSRPSALPWGRKTWMSRRRVPAAEHGGMSLRGHDTDNARCIYGFLYPGSISSKRVQLSNWPVVASPVAG